MHCFYYYSSSTRRRPQPISFSEAKAIYNQRRSIWILSSKQTPAFSEEMPWHSIHVSASTTATDSSTTIDVSAVTPMVLTFTPTDPEICDYWLSSNAKQLFIPKDGEAVQTALVRYHQ
jgi:hypothetical protein